MIVFREFFSNKNIKIYFNLNLFLFKILPYIKNWKYIIFPSYNDQTFEKNKLLNIHLEMTLR